MSKTQQPLGHYNTVNAYGAAEADNGLDLILSMMRGANDRIASARGHMERKEAQGKGEQLGKAIALIDGLRGALNVDEGGEIAGNLDALYDYMNRRLVEGNAMNDVAALDEVSALLAEIREAWEGVVAQAAAPAVTER
ncbi:MAG: flagellar export chaperone FliS [Gammaproteobacteria bacterium]|nr:flagellar export chaperone FliS [Gammaproteobacteria bacterium]